LFCYILTKKKQTFSKKVCKCINSFINYQKFCQTFF